MSETPGRRFVAEHTRYIANQDIERMVRQTYAEDAVLYHNFRYFDGEPPYIHRGQADIIHAQRVIFDPKNLGNIQVGEPFNFIEAEDTIFFQVVVTSPTQGRRINTDFWIVRDGKLYRQYDFWTSLESLGATTESAATGDLYYVQMHWNIEGRLSFDGLWDLEARGAEFALASNKPGTRLYKVAGQKRVIGIIEVDSIKELDRTAMGRLPLREFLEFEAIWPLREYKDFLEDVKVHYRV